MWKRFLSRKFLVAVAGLVAIALGVEEETLVAAVVAAYVATEGLIDAVGVVIRTVRGNDAPNGEPSS